MTLQSLPAPAFKVHGANPPKRATLSKRIDKPDWLEGHASDVWDSIVPELLRAGLVCAIDVFVLAAFCESSAMLRDASAQLRVKLTLNNLRFYRAAFKTFMDCCRLIGATPLDRARLQRAMNRVGGR